MKKLLILACFIAVNISALAQQNYTIDNETLELKTEVDGALDLLWNTFNGQFRYFIKDSNETITELTNTKNTDSRGYQEEYKTTLNELTQSSMSADKVKLTLASLKNYINNYNALKDTSYTYEERAKIKIRSEIFGGITNSPFIVNPDNTLVPFFGFELEILEEKNLPRHAGFFRIKTNFKHSDFEYSASELALGYRFRFINKAKFSIYTNVKFATYTFSNTTVTLEDATNPGTFITEDVTDSGFEAPFVFGLGADIKVGSKSYITVSYNELAALFLDNEDNFPIDFALGYKINL